MKDLIFNVFPKIYGNTSAVSLMRWADSVDVHSLNKTVDGQRIFAVSFEDDDNNFFIVGLPKSTAEQLEM